MEKEIADMLGTMSDHIVNSIVIAIGEAKQDILKKLSGKEVKITITLPADLDK